MTKTVYVMGAGTSVCAGAPVTTSFRRAALQALAAEGPRGILQRAMSEWDQFPQLNVEEFYVLADVKARLSGNPRSQLSDDARYLIMKTLDHALRDAKTAHHDRFIRRIWANAGRDGRNLAVITTNWDILIDNAVRRFKDDPSLDLTAYLSYGLHDAPARGSIDAARNTIKVLKLHGSLNWWYCPEHQEVELGGKEKETVSYYETGEGPRCPFSARPDEAEHVMVPFFVPPSAQKFETQGPTDPITKLWVDARHELQNAEHLVFVGYSFPELDVQFRMLVTQALKENKVRKTITVVTSKKLGAERVQFEERLRIALAGLDQYGSVVIEDSGFEGWV